MWTINTFYPFCLLSNAAGADSHSDESSVSGGVPWDSRETSLAASTAASLASSLPLRDVPDLNEDAKLGGHSDKSTNESLDSGSSFEELDMDQEERRVEEEEDVEGKENSGENIREKEEPLGDEEE